MKRFSIKVTDDRDNVDYYTDASSIKVDNDKIEIEYDNKHASHQMCHTDEIIIKPNH